MNNNRSVWIDADVEIDQLLHEKQYEEISAYVKKNLNLMYETWKSENYEDLELTLSMGDSIMEFLKEGIKEKSKDMALFNLGGLYRTVKMYLLFLYELGINKRLQIQYKQEMDSIKHLDSVIFALEIHGSMTHSELADYLGLKHSTMTEAMRRIAPTGVVQTVSAGKYKLYSLTETGVRLGKMLRRDSTLDSVESIIKRLQLEIDKLSDEEKKSVLTKIISTSSIPGSMVLSSGDKLKYYYEEPGRRESLESIITLLVEEKGDKYIFSRHGDHSSNVNSANVFAQYSPKRNKEIVRDFIGFEAG